MSQEESDVVAAVLASPACGSIDPAARVEAGEISDEMVDKIAGEVGLRYVWIRDRLVEVDGEEIKVTNTMAIPKWCVDGRGEDGDTTLAPNAAGGTYSLVVGDALIDAQPLIANGATSAEHGAAVFSRLQKNGYDIGGHQDNHATAENCGCGACDKMGTIFDFLAENMDKLSTKAAALGVEVNGSLQTKIKTNIQDLQAAKYVSTGFEMNQAIIAASDESHSQKLVGSHNEVVVVVNTVSGTTLDRKALEKEFGDSYQAFNLDVWALKNGINAISTSEQEASEKFAAAVLYNLATTCVLAGPSLRVVVR